MSGYLQQQNQNNTQQPKSCERIIQGVAKLSTFKIPSTHLKRFYLKNISKLNIKDVRREHFL